MGRKSSIDKLPPRVRRIVEKRAADPAATSESVREELVAALPDGGAPSARALRRWFARKSEVIARVKESREVARVLVADVGERVDSDQGRALVEILHSLVHQATHRLAAEEEKDAKIGELKALAQTIKLANESGAIAQRTAERIEAAARAKLLREQQEALKSIVKEGGISGETERIIRGALGIP